jgi:hypothetical protein
MEQGHVPTPAFDMQDASELLGHPTPDDSIGTFPTVPLPSILCNPLKSDQTNPVSPFPHPQPPLADPFEQITPSPEAVNHPPDLAFPSIHAISNTTLPQGFPTRPELKQVTRNFKLPSFETLGITSNQASSLMGTHLLVQPFPGLIQEHSPTLSPNDTNPSTIHQYIITRTPPADADSHPTFTAATDFAERPSITQSIDAVAESESNFESQWTTEMVPKISTCPSIIIVA